ncbi:HET-domain-containing protein [Venturia nashicola]|nr:HET-domain-containing protein [Venturia nashicola]
MEDKIEIVADMLEAWNSTVESYSTKCMTKEEDRLPALSGIAKRFQNIFVRQYLAGIWERRLILGLCWYVGSPGKRPEKYIAPSWFWASVLNVEMYPERMDIKDAEETKIEIQIF